MTLRKFCICLVFFTLFSGCGASVEKWKGLKFKNASQETHQTFNYSVQWVDEATLRVLDQMEILIIDNSSSASGKSIKAATMDLDILIEITSLAPNSTQMRINIQYSKNQQTNSTAKEIFYQTRQMLLSDKRLKKSSLLNPMNPI